MTDDANLTWAVLAPAAATVIEPMVAGAWRDRFGDDDDDLARWDVRPGRGAYSSVLCRLPGTEGDDETLALRLSGALPGEIFALRFLEGGEAAWVYVNGAFVREDSRSPRAVARALGCDVDAPAPPTGDTAGPRDLCVVEGAGVRDVEQALRGLLGDVAIAVAPNAIGVIAHAASGSLGMIGPSLAGQLPGTTVYTVVSGPGPRLAVIVSRGDDDLGAFAAGGSAMPNYAPLRDVRGATSAAGILAALDVPPSLLGRQAT